MLCIFFTSSWIYINSDWRSHILTVFLARSCTSRPAVKSSPLTHVRADWRPARQDFKTGGKRLHLFHFHPLPKASALFRSHTGLTGRSAVLPPGQWRGVCRGDQSDLALPQRLGFPGMAVAYVVHHFLRFYLANFFPYSRFHFPRDIIAMGFLGTGSGMLGFGLNTYMRGGCFLAVVGGWGGLSSGNFCGRPIFLSDLWFFNAHMGDIFSSLSWQGSFPINVGATHWSVHGKGCGGWAYERENLRSGEKSIRYHDEKEDPIRAAGVYSAVIFYIASIPSFIQRILCHLVCCLAL